MLTQRRLKEVLKYNPKTGDFIQMLTTSQRIKVGQKAGTITDGYNIITIDGKHFRGARLAFLYMVGYFPEHDVDHKNRVRSDDRWSNLRHTTRSCNIKNAGNRADNTSGVKGVTWNNDRGKWVAQMTVNKKNKNLGGYRSFCNAVCARLAGEQCLGWDQCDNNSPAQQYVKKNIIEQMGGLPQ